MFCDVPSLGSDRHRYSSSAVDRNVLQHGHLSPTSVLPPSSAQPRLLSVCCIAGAHSCHVLSQVPGSAAGGGTSA